MSILPIDEIKPVRLLNASTGSNSFDSNDYSSSQGGPTYVCSPATRRGSSGSKLLPNEYGEQIIENDWSKKRRRERRGNREECVCQSLD